MQVIILMGVPGAGKSTWIRGTPEFQQKNFYICNSDRFLYDENGSYKWTPERQSRAHRDCLREYVQVIVNSYYNNYETIFVDNTNITLAELAPYVAVAQAFDVPVKIVHIEAADPERAWERNQHNVPSDVHCGMAWKLLETLRQLPSWFPRVETVQMVET